MKRISLIILSIILVFSLSVSAFAATSVPESVMQSTESVVRVLAEYSDGYATGSGFVIKSDKKETLIATNYHVVEGNPYSISVWISEDETVSASILAYTDQKDMCILKLAYPISLRPLAFSSKSAKQGDAVYAVGFPGAADYLSDKEAHASADATITDGIVSAVREATVSRFGTPTKILQINAAINSGNSGGPLFNVKGEVVGINTLGIDDSQGIFGAIDVSELENFMADHGIPIPKAGASFSWMIIVITAILIILVVVIVFVIKGKKNMKPSAPKATQALSLSKYMEQHPGGIGMYNAVAMLLPVALQLRNMHNDGKAHLEVSPNSIYIVPNGATLNETTSIESNRYTSGYAAPEIYKGCSAGNLSDIYSFSALLYFVATGVQPVNSLSRTGDEYQFDELSSLDALFAKIIQNGTALETTERIASMQDIIVKLSVYNTHPFVNDAIFAEPVAKENTSPRKRKVSPTVIVVSIAVLLLITLLGTYFGCYVAAKSNAANRDFSTADKLLLLPFITELHDSKLVSYVEAGVLLENREYAEAAEAFASLGKYEDSKELTNEANYRLALQYADKNNFSKAVSILSTLSKQNYKDAKEKTRAVQYRWAWSLIDEGEYIEAYEKLEDLGNYSDAEETLAGLTELIYIEAQTLYTNHDHDDAKKLFNYVAPYADSRKYLTLINAWGSGGWVDPDQTVDDLVDLFYFEDATELLLAHDTYACRFLLGTWRTNGGGYYFKMETSSSDDWEFWCSYNLPWWECTSFEIDDGTYFITTPSGELKKMYEFRLLTPDSMEVYCYKDGSTYTLYR